MSATESWIDEDLELVPESVTRRRAALDSQNDRLARVHGSASEITGEWQEIALRIVGEPADESEELHQDEADAGSWLDAGERRTVRITGQAAPAPSLRLVETERRRPSRTPAERVASHPDRIALWAAMLGFFLILVAATSGAPS